MPKTDKIRYASITALQRALQDRARLREDFVIREEQMQRDFIACKQRLNDLYDLQNLLYKQHNPTLLAKYHLARK